MKQLLWILPLSLLCLMIGCDSGRSKGEDARRIAPREATDPVPEPPVPHASDGKARSSNPSQQPEQPLEKLYRITGTEPFWSLTLARPYSTFRSMEGDSLTFSYQAPKQAAARAQDWVQLFPLATDHWVLLRRSHTPCSDGMSDREWEYTATLWLNGQLWDGCGEKLAAKDSQQ